MRTFAHGSSPAAMVAAIVRKVDALSAMLMNYKLSSTGSFDRLQQALATELVRSIKEELEKVDTPDDLIEQLTGSIAFAVTCLLDDVAGIENCGEVVSPVVTFDVGNETLEHAGGSTYMHEYVFRVLPAVFGHDD